jgi:hypothetical protein
MKNWTSKYKPEEGLFPSTGMLTSVGSGPKVPTMRNGGLLSRTVTCSDCGWSWKAVDGGKDSLTCHKCGGMIKMKHGGQGPGDDELAFQQFFKTLPTNLRKDSPDYNMRGYWNALGKPTEFDYSQPKEDDGYYHASSRNPQTGEILKAPFHPTFKQAISEDRKAGYFPIVTPDGKVKTVSGYDLKPGQSVYANGGDISLPNVYPNAMIPKYGPGGQTTDGCPANYHMTSFGCMPNTALDFTANQTQQAQLKSSNKPIKQEGWIDFMLHKFRNDQTPETLAAKNTYYNDKTANTMKAVTAVGQMVPHPLIKYPSMFLNTALGLTMAKDDYQAGNYGHAFMDVSGLVLGPTVNGLKVLKNVHSFAPTAIKGAEHGAGIFSKLTDLTNNFRFHYGKGGEINSKSNWTDKYKF